MAFVEERDLPLLISLQEKPLAPASRLAKTVGLSTPTVISRLRTLKAERSYYSVIADLKPEALEMEIIDVILEINNIDNVKYIEKHICYNHPFTLFRIRCFGNLNGLYLQFRTPKGSKELLKDLFRELQQRKIIDDFFIATVISQAKSIYTKSNLTNWEPKMMRWSFDWDNWINKYEKMKNEKRLMKTEEQSCLEKIDQLDMALLEELTMNARRKNTEIMESLNLDKHEVGVPQRVSRKIKFLQKKVIQQYRVFLRWETFEIYNSFLIFSECDEQTANNLQNHLAKMPIPFESVLKLTEEGFMWYLRCPASHFSEISDFVWSISDKAHFYFLDYKTSEFYGIWKGAYDAENRQWKIELMRKEKLLA
ncbi:MAG: hypothetical protein GF308_20740 [Candidatus Heimdallarchaeota archaeon]|nr:hypothetical protein [Candidatus Heimdallarchaeota archaeon]